MFIKAFGSTPLILCLRMDASLPESSYRIKVSGRRTCVEASSPTGFFYALQRLFHSLPADINGIRHADHVEWTIPSMSVHDAPTTGCSGIVLDMTRSIIPKDNMLHLIESMPDMGVYELTVFNAGCYTKTDFNEIHRCALRNNVELVSEVKID